MSVDERERALQRAVAGGDEDAVTFTADRHPALAQQNLRVALLRELGVERRGE